MRASWAHNVLIGAARRELDWALLGAGTPQAWDELLLAASARGMDGWLARELTAQSRTPPHVSRILQASAAQSLASHTRALDDLSRAVEVLRRAGTETTPLDGPVLTERSYGDGGMRSCRRTEVLVHPSVGSRATRALIESGFKLAQPPTEEARFASFHGPSGSMIDLRGHVFAPGTRAALGMATDELWGEAEHRDFEGFSCRVLPASEEAARLCLKASLEGLELIRLLDIAGLICNESVDWDRSGALLSRWRVTGTGYLVLLLVREWTGARIPLEELDLPSPDPLRRTAFRMVADSVDVARGRGRKVLAGIAGLAADSWSARRLLVSPPRGALADEKRHVNSAVTVPRPVVLFSPSRSMGMSHYVEALAQAMEPSVEVIALDGAKQASLLGLWRRLARLVRRRGAMVLVTSPHPSVPLGLVFAGARRGGFVFHDPILDAPGKLMRPLHVLYYRALTRRLGTVVLHGAVFRRQVLDLRLKAREVVVVPHGLAPSEMAVEAPYDPAGPLVFLGRLHPYKGLAVLLAALRSLRARGIRPEVVVGGRGVTATAVPEDLHNVQVIARELTDNEFRDLIGRCSAVLLPYERANQSGVLATAFRAGRPVIASSVGSFPEYVDDGGNGLLAPPGDIQALAEAIRRISTDPDLARRLAEGAAHTGKEILDPARAGAEIVAVLQR